MMNKVEYIYTAQSDNKGVGLYKLYRTFIDCWLWILNTKLKIFYLSTYGTVIWHSAIQ